MTDPHDDLEVVDLTDVGGHSDRSRSKVAPRPTARDTLAGWRRVSLGVAAVVGIALLWVLVGGLVLLDVRSDLEGARDDLDSVLTAVSEDDYDGALTSLRTSEEVFGSVEGRVAGPLVAPLRVVPGLRGTLLAVERLSRAAGLVTGAGVDLVDGLGLGEQGIGAFAPVDGRFPVEVFEDLQPLLAEAEVDVRRAAEVASDIPRTGIDEAVLAARREFEEVLEVAIPQLSALARFTEVVPAMVGRDEARRYLVVASNPTEPRGSGGYFGAYTVMTADDGRLSFDEVVTTDDLPVLPRDVLPWPDESLQARYEGYGGSGFFRNLNMTPDFPSAATMIEAYFAEALDQPLDGVIAVDPFAFEALLTIGGPVEIPGYGEIGADEVVEFVSHSAYSELSDPDERKRLIGVVATAVLQRVLERPDEVDAAGLLAGLAALLDTESILIHAADPDVQAVFEDLSLAGRLGSGLQDGEALPDNGDFLGVFFNSGASYKVDYWVERRIEYEVTLGPGGVVGSIITLGVTNDAPTTGEPGIMIGFGDPPLDVGDSLSFVSVYCGRSCRFYETPDEGFLDLETEVSSELGYQVASTWLRLTSGQSGQLAWTTSTSGGWFLRGVEQVYRLDYEHQPSIRPTVLDLRVEVPDGTVAVAMPEGAVVEDDVVVWEQPVSGDQLIEIVFAPPMDT